LDKSGHLHVLDDLIGGVKVRHPTGWHLRVLVGIIVGEILAAKNIEVAIQLPSICDPVVDRPLETLAWNRRDMVARRRPAEAPFHPAD
jgi:hypothetical protein